MDDSNSPEAKPAETNTFLQQAQPLIATYAANSKAANTWKEYRADLQDFTAWCQIHDLVSLPAIPETVTAYRIRIPVRRNLLTTLSDYLFAFHKVLRASLLEVCPASISVLRKK